MAKKSNNYFFGIVILIVFVIGAYFLNDQLSLIGTDDKGYDFSCRIVQDSCVGWSDCKIVSYKGNNIACVNGEEIGQTFVDTIQTNKNVVSEGDSNE